ncbi:YafY family protein [Homoserinibacter sp. GY 40078]|uniref:helix-turn-helix transcriptional regulator n=1 Tax=Homoserinibacter sp. GY 40078 TaxID=2603275 RepID=UPI0011CC233E|nr:YafY family protein [Homoserinibacter sp. GY 40078]TXK18795.1 YafY family transcriptional regulator [Homoserinibacter sp. GY 40078]
MHQATRALAVLEVLQSGGTHPVTELRERFAVAERTIRRDIELLLEAGVPVESVRGRRGGYRITPGYRTPSLLFTDDEALTTVVGLLLAGEAGLLRDADGAAASAAAKLRRTLPPALRRRVDALLTSVAATGSALPTTPAATRTVLDLADAVREHREVQLVYTRGDGTRLDRIVRPYGVVAHDRRWYLVAASVDDDAPRVYRIDRVLRQRTRDAVFRAPTGFDARSHLIASLASVPRAHRVEVRVAAPLEHVLRRFPPGVAEVEEAGDGWWRIVLQAERLDWVAAAIAGLGSPLVIDEPPQLRDELRVLAARLHAAAEA